MTRTPDLVALAGSRICHDLVSPLGAIGNGLELMLLAGGEQTPEMALVAESLKGANARIRFFRIAFGASRDDSTVSERELREALACFEGRKTRIDWEIAGDLMRAEAKRALLAVNCLDSAMPFGGTIRVTRAEGGLRVTGEAARMTLEADDWNMLEGVLPDDIAPAKLHFALLRADLDGGGAPFRLDRGEARIEMHL